LIDEMRALGLIVRAPSASVCAEKTEKRALCLPEQTPFAVEFPSENQLLIEWKREDDGTLTAKIPVRSLDMPIAIVFSDPITDLKANARVRRGDEKNTSFILSGVTDTLNLSVVPAAEKLPFAWLRGDFAVLCADGWREFDENQMSCGGRFFIEGSAQKKILAAGELVSQGLPFFGGAVTARKSFTLTEDMRGEMDFDGLRACAARISVDGKTLGWWWRGRTLPVSLSAGAHTLTVEAVPSTYNTYGPHRYYLGDCRLTSPDTFFGRGGYTDNADAPAYTLIDSMQFVKFSVDGDVVLFAER
jgi:hypothetical protein